MYEVSNEVVEVKEEAELLRLQMDVAQQEEEAARAALAAAQAALAAALAGPRRVSRRTGATGTVHLCISPLTSALYAAENKAVLHYLSRLEPPVQGMGGPGLQGPGSSCGTRG